MAEEFVSVIKIETGDSEQTVKGLKQQISDLRDEILNLEKGTEQYDNAVDALQDSQRKLDEVMSLTKKTATALDGSYDALVHKMSQLKKEWRATNDEARRNELGQQIAEINGQLKDFDASLGNFQRNVGNYQSALDGMEDKTEDFATSMRNMQETIEPTKAKFESVQKIASGVASGFAAVQGAAALLGVENENLEKTFIKLQAAMALAQGVGGLGDLVEGIGKAKVAFAGLGDKVKALSKVMGKGGWIGVIIAAVAALTALVVWIKKTRQESEEFSLSLEEQKELNEDLGRSIGDVVAQYRIFQNQYNNLKTDDEKKRWIEENAGAFEKLGLNIKDVNSADEAFIKQTDKVIAALKARAKAEALTDKYKEAIIKAETDKLNYKPPIPESIEGSLTSGKFTTPGYEELQEFYEPADGYYTGSLVSFQRKKGVSDETIINASPKIQAQIEQDMAKINATVTYWEDMMSAAQEEALNLQKSLGSLGNTSKKPKIITKEDALALAEREIMKTLEEDLANIPEIELEMPEIKLEDVEGKSKKKAEILIDLAERVAQREMELNAMSGADTEIKAQREYEINLKLQEDKLALLKRFYDEAGKNGDLESWFDLQQDIADQEIEIEKAKYAEMERLDKQALEEKKRRHQEGMAITTQSLQSAADITNALADLMEQKANENGEVSEAEAKKIKGLRIATATMDMLQGIVSAIGSAAGMGPVGWVLGAIQAASIATLGGINIAKIKNTDFTGNSSATPSVTPSTSTYASELPATFTRQITGASEIESLNQDTRVYILESDIQASNKRVQVRENESSF